MGFRLGQKSCRLYHTDTVSIIGIIDVTFIETYNDTSTNQEAKHPLIERHIYIVTNKEAKHKN